MAAQRMNDTSSRSHTILHIDVYQTRYLYSNASTNSLIQNTSFNGNIEPESATDKENSFYMKNHGKDNVITFNKRFEEK